MKRGVAKMRAIMRPIWIGVVALSLLTGPADAQQSTIQVCEDEIGPLRYLVRLYGQTRTEAEFEMARQRARADRAEAAVERMRRIADAWKKAAEEWKSKVPADLPAGQTGEGK